MTLLLLFGRTHRFDALRNLTRHRFTDELASTKNPAPLPQLIVKANDAVSHRFAGRADGFAPLPPVRGRAFVGGHGANHTRNLLMHVQKHLVKC